MESKKINKGTIVIEVSVISPEKFLNLLWNKNIKVSKIKKIDMTTIRFEISYEDYEEVINLAHNLKGKCRVVSSKGLIFILEKLKRHASILVGI